MARVHWHMLLNLTILSTEDLRLAWQVSIRVVSTYLLSRSRNHLVSRWWLASWKNNVFQPLFVHLLEASHFILFFRDPLHLNIFTRAYRSVAETTSAVNENVWHELLRVHKNFLLRYAWLTWTCYKNHILLLV